MCDSIIEGSRPHRCRPLVDSCPLHARLKPSTAAIHLRAIESVVRLRRAALAARLDRRRHRSFVLAASTTCCTRSSASHGLRLMRPESVWVLRAPPGLGPHRCLAGARELLDRLSRLDHQLPPGLDGASRVDRRRPSSRTCTPHRKCRREARAFRRRGRRTPSSHRSAPALSSPGRR